MNIQIEESKKKEVNIEDNVLAPSSQSNCFIISSFKHGNELVVLFFLSDVFDQFSTFCLYGMSVNVGVVV